MRFIVFHHKDNNGISDSKILRLKDKGTRSSADLVANREVVLTKEVWERTQKLAIFMQIPTHFKAKHEKGVGTPFPRVPAPLHPCG